MTRNSIKPIETNYRGYKFRSRLEARWAVFFDHMEIEFYYEPEGYQLPSGWYLPDFLLKNVNPSCVHSDINNLSMWAEVKSIDFSDLEDNLFLELCNETKTNGLYLVGPPDFKLYYDNFGYEYALDWYSEAQRHKGFVFVVIDSRFSVEEELTGYNIVNANESCPAWSNLYRQAVYASRRARF